MYRIQSTELIKVNKDKNPSEDASIPLKRRNSLITGVRGKVGPGEKGEGEGKWGQDQVWGETGEKPRGPEELMEICSSQELGG